MSCGWCVGKHYFATVLKIQKVFHYFCQSISEETLKIAYALKNNQTKLELLSALAIRLGREQNQSIIDFALEARHYIHDSQKITNFLKTISAQTSMQLITSETLSQKLNREDYQKISDQTALEKLQSMNVIHEEWFRITVLDELADFISEEITRKAIEACRSIGQETEKARLLARLAKNLPDSEQNSIINEALQIVNNLKLDWARASALKDIAKYAIRNKDRFLLDAFYAAYQVENADVRNTILKELNSQITQPELLHAIEPANLSEIIHLRIRKLGNIPRDTMLLDLQNSLPLLFLSGLDQQKLAENISIICNWWP